MNNGIFTGVIELAKKFRSRETTARDYLESLLDHIAKYEPKFKAFQIVYEKESRIAADAADLAIRNGQDIGPFHGIPFALKDLIDIEGRITTGGSAILQNRVSPVTATIAKRLLSQGGILIGKTKTVEFAMGGWGTNQHMGTPINPWSTGRPHAPGGSSSGSGVAVASGMVPCAVGTDTAGSVRLPAAFCGIVGLKVTEGYLPLDGIIPLSHTFDTPGPMTRCVADAALMSDVMAGHDHTSLQKYLTLPSPPIRKEQSLHGIRLGILSDRDRASVSSDILNLYDSALDILKNLGAELIIFEPPVSYSEMGKDSGLIFVTEGYTHNKSFVEDPSTKMDVYVRMRFLENRDVKAHTYIQALLRRKDIITQFNRQMAELSALILPTTTTASVPLNEVDENTSVGWFTRPFNFLAMCGLSLPMGLTKEGLPGSMQIAARGGDEATAIFIAKLFESAIGQAMIPNLLRTGKPGI